MWWDGATWQAWNGGTCTKVAAAADGSAFTLNDCGAVQHSGGRLLADAAAANALRAGLRCAHAEHAPEPAACCPRLQPLGRGSRCRMPAPLKTSRWG